MMTAVNISFFDTINTPYDLLTGVNTASGGAFSLFLVGVFFMLVLIVFQRYDFKRVLLFDSFACSILMFYMILMQWMSFEYIMFAMLMLFISIFMMIFMKD